MTAMWEIPCCSSTSGVCLPGQSYREDVCLQEAGEEEDKEEERGVHGSQREADFRESQQ